MKIAVIGSGSWGTTVASLMAPADNTTLWARREEISTEISERKSNSAYLGEAALDPQLNATSDLAEALAGAEIVVMAVPTHGTRSVLEQAADFIGAEALIVSLSKGFEPQTRKRMTEVAREVLDHDPTKLGVLTGPNLAKEVLAGQPTASVVAFSTIEAAEIVQAHVPALTFRVYTSTDVVGCEASGALKNVMAIGSGMARGLGFGDNTRAALITRALNELGRIGIAMGGRPSTFAGLAGMGDLIATCSSLLSRNLQVGLGLGQGRKLDEITSEMNMVAEGVKTTESALVLADKLGIDARMSRQVGRVLYENVPPMEALQVLLERPPGREYELI